MGLGKDRQVTKTLFTSFAQHIIYFKKDHENEKSSFFNQHTRYSIFYVVA